MAFPVAMVVTMACWLSRFGDVGFSLGRVEFGSCWEADSAGIVVATMRGDNDVGDLVFGK